jgi:bacterioferritin (cytochrome b1)
MITPASVLDILYGLFESEEASIFRFMRQGEPYLTRATVETRHRIEAMADTSLQHAAQLANLIELLGGTIRLSAVHPENQFLAFLSLNFLIPKLAQAKRQSIERYENALNAARGADTQIVDLLKSHLARHRADLAALESAKPGK